MRRIPGRPDPRDPAPVTGLRGTVWLVALLLVGLVVVTALTGQAPEIPAAPDPQAAQ